MATKLKPKLSAAASRKVLEQRRKARAEFLAQKRQETLEKSPEKVEDLFPTAEDLDTGKRLTEDPVYPVIPMHPLQAAPAAAIEPFAPKEGVLATLATHINVRFERAARNDQQAFDHRLQAAVHLAEAKVECEKRGINFRKWAEASIGQTYDTVRKMAAIGASDNPRLALEDLRDRNRLNNQRLRVKQKVLGAKRPMSEIKQELRIAHSPDFIGPPMPPAQADELIGRYTRTNAVDQEAASETVNHVSEGMEETGIFHAIAFMDVHQQRALADRSAKTLPVDELIAHVEEVGRVIGFGIHRLGDESNYPVTFDIVLRDFTSLPSREQMDFVAWAAQSVGALIELPASS